MSLATNPTSCKIRHIVRCAEDDPGAIQVGRVHFRAADPKGVNGSGGWVSAEMTSALTNDGGLKIRFPNVAGPDGVLHRRRFAIFTEDRYRIGREWIEVRREGEKLISVCTPASYDISLTDITLSCVDALALTSLVRDEALHPWCAPPRDVLDYYGRLETPWVLRDFAGWSLTGTGTSPDGWDHKSAAPDPAGVLIGDAGRVLFDRGPGPASTGEAWSANFIGRLLHGHLICSAFGSQVNLWDNGNVIVEDNSGSPGPTHTRTDVGANKPFSVRVYRRGDWIFVQINGETVEVRRAAATYDHVAVITDNFTQVVVSEITSSTLERCLVGVDEPGDLHLPGAPTPGGLSGRYFLESDAKARHAPGFDVAAFTAAALNPLQDEYSNRTDVTLNFAPSTNPPTFMPSGPAGAHWWSARWTGSIYLDLAAGDRALQLVAGHGDVTKVWLGRRGPGEAALLVRGSGQGTTAYTSGSLRTHLGQSVAGWYPIIIEYVHTFDTGGLALRDGPVGGAYTVVPSSRLSPYGVYEDQVQRESHRSMIDQVTQAFGYQWAIQPRSLESGSFPGRLIPRVRQGRDTNVRITAPEGTNVRATANAADAADRLIIDAAGLAAPGGAASLSAEAWNIPSALNALFVATSAESTPEITDPALAKQRAESLLSLHAGAMQSVQVTPRGERTLVDTWPLTGELARMEWEPGDGVLYDLPEIAVVDRSPRQLTGVTWPLRPAGVGAPQITVRSRPMGLRSLALRGLQIASAAQRNYQGQLGPVSSNVGSNNPVWATEEYCSVQVDPTTIVALEARVGGLVTAGTLEVNGVSTGLGVWVGARLDVTPWLASYGEQNARILSPTGDYKLTLVATVEL